MEQVVEAAADEIAVETRGRKKRTADEMQKFAKAETRMKNYYKKQVDDLKKQLEAANRKVRRLEAAGIQLPMVQPENIVGVGNNVGPDGMNVVEAEEVRVPRATNVLGQKSKKCYSMPRNSNADTNFFRHYQAHYAQPKKM